MAGAPPGRGERAALPGPAADARTWHLRRQIWQTRTQLELAILEYVGWFNDARLHEALGYLPPAEFEALAAARNQETSERMIYC